MMRMPTVPGFFFQSAITSGHRRNIGNRAGVDLRVRVQPDGHLIPGRVKERTELDSLTAAVLTHPRSPPD